MKRLAFHLDRERDVSLRCYTWLPKDTTHVKAVIQIAHGMAEHILRYETFAEYIVKQGYIVCGNDHRGHGGSIIAPDDRGFFADQNGFEKVVADLHALTRLIKKDYPKLPIVLFGHSLGSYLSRRYIQRYGSDIAGTILSGTGGSQGIIGKIGRILAKIESRRIGPRTPSTFMNTLTFGIFNKQFMPARTDFDFLSRSEKAIDRYMTDKDCGFICSARFYEDLLYGIERIHQPNEIHNIPKSLPIYLISGDKDPVGNNGKGVQNVYEQYKRFGLEHVQLTLYPNARHEILNEINQEEVYADIRNWLSTSAV